MKYEIAIKKLSQKPVMADLIRLSFRAKRETRCQDVQDYQEMWVFATPAMT